MNRQSKSAIKSLVLTLRRKMEDEITIQLKRYGFAGARWLPLDRLPHINRDDRASIEYFHLQNALEQHLRRIGANPADATAPQRAEAVEWFGREIAFTHLNRLIALKCLEVRELIPEIITTRDAYGGRSRAHYDYRNAHPDETRGADDALPNAIRHACRQVYAEFKFLFDVGDPAIGREPPANTILWLSYPVLKECIALINDLDAAAENEGQTLWAEDEIIGWIYQFYNAEHKEAVRKRGKPRRPAEVAVINQFFTPRWIVKFLVDNTLGRLWLEMHPDSARVRAKCDYLVPEPRKSANEQIGKSAHEQDGRFALDPNSPINDPNAPARRAPKRPQDIRLIDPACGTMHFGHYAFEVFQEIYRDANEHGWYAETHRRDAENAEYAQKNSQRTPRLGGEQNMFHRRGAENAEYAQKNSQRTPRLGGEQNMFNRRGAENAEISGSANSASLRLNSPIPEADIPAAILRHNLYGVDIDLRAVQLAGLSLFIKAKMANPQAHIAHVNLVVADVVLPADGAREQFLAQYQDDLVVQDAVRQVLDEMENIAEVGSLLRVEERLRDILGKAGHIAAAEWDAERQQTMPGFEPSTRQLSLADSAGAAPEEWGAHYTLSRLLDDLRAFAANALQTHDLNALLFAAEAEKSVHLLDVFLNDYDAVVMNPPYGSTMSKAQKYLKTAYPNSYKNLYASFIERGISLLIRQGYLGALTERMYLVQYSFNDFRTKVLQDGNTILGFLDLWYGVLDDAMNRTTATVFTNRGSIENEHFFALNLDCEDKKTAYEEALKLNKLVWVNHNIPPQMPYGMYVYQMPASVIELAISGSNIATEFEAAKAGLQTSSDAMSVRYWWEMTPVVIQHRPFRSFIKGGVFSRYYRDICYILDYCDSAKRRYKEVGVTRNPNFYFEPCVSWPDVSMHLNAQYNPPGSIFSAVSWAIFINSEQKLKTLTALLNSEVVNFFAAQGYDGHHWAPGVISRIPCPHFSRGGIEFLADKTNIAYSLKAAWDTGNEICTRFTAPWLIQAHRAALLPALNNSASGVYPRTGTPLRLNNSPTAETQSSQSLASENSASSASLRLNNLPTAEPQSSQSLPPENSASSASLRLNNSLTAEPQSAQSLASENSASSASLRSNNSLTAEPQSAQSLAQLLDHVRAIERAADARLQELQAQIDETVYDLYDISPADRVLIERELGDRPPELVWPQMEGKADKEKRREHVRRLVSYFLLTAIKAKRDGILPLTPVADQQTALAAVRRGLEAEFGERAAFDMEDEIKQILGRDLPDWLDREFFKWHVKLYKSRPIIWHLASPGNHFACLLYYHQLDADALRKVQTAYLWSHRRALQAELEAAQADKAAGVGGAVARLDRAEAALDDLAEFEARLKNIIEARVAHQPPDWAKGPFRDGVYDPVIDDGVKVNIEPLQIAEVLRYNKVV